MSAIESACTWAVGIANDNSHGYDQLHRQGPNYDCSSLTINAWEQAGVKVKEAGATYTGNMRAAFVKCGFKAIKYVKGMELKRGDVVLNEKHHVLMYLGSNKMVQASSSETGGITGKTGDQTGREIYVGNFYEFSKGWDYVLRYEVSEVTTVNITMPVLQKGSKCPEVGTVQTLLNALGYVGKNGRKLTVDHDYGQNVEFAVKNFQKAHGLVQDGIVGARTWPELLKADY